MMIQKLSLPLWGLLTCKCLALPLAVGSVSGLLANLRHLQRFGMTSSTAVYAVAGIIFAVLLLWMCVDALRMPVRAGRKRN